VTTVGQEPLDGATGFASMAAAYEEAAQARPESVSTSYCMFAGRLARVRVVGHGLARELERPFAHLWLRDDPGIAPQLTVDLWDQAATGVGCTGCEVPPSPAGPPRATASADGRFVVYHVIHTRAAFDRVRRHVVGWVSSSDQLSVYERARPLAGPLLLWLSDDGVQAVHAGLVARDGRGVLFGGPSGAGKSTVALTCAQAGFDYLADDHVGLEEDGRGAFLGHALFCSANLEPNHLQRLPALSPHAIRGGLPEDDKSLLLLSEFLPGRLTPTVSIAAVALPRVVSSPTTTLRPASKMEAALRLAPSSMFVLPHARGVRAGLGLLARLVESVPSYWLDLGQDLNEIPARIEEILGRGDD
jgi:hypothetical protein